jgi:hypothetical protein
MAIIPDLHSLIEDVRRLDGRCNSILLVAYCNVKLVKTVGEEQESLPPRAKQVQVHLISYLIANNIQAAEQFERESHNAELDSSRWGSYWDDIEATVGVPASSDSVRLLPTLGIPVWQIGAVHQPPILAHAGRVVDGNVRECIIAGFDLEVVHEAYSIFRRAGAMLRTQTLAAAGISPSPNAAANWIAHLLVEFKHRAKSARAGKAEFESCRVLEHPLSATRELLERNISSGNSITAVGYEPTNGEAGAQGDGEPEAGPRKVNPKPRIRVDAESLVVHIDGKAWPLNGKQSTKTKLAAFIQELIDADGSYLSMTQRGIKTAHVEQQPEAIKNLFEAQPGGGTRIPREKLV